MESKEINLIENRIKQLKNQARALEFDKAKAIKRTEKVRKPILINTIILAVIHFVGTFIHPFVVIGALTFLLINTIVGAVLIFRREDQEQAIQKEIDAYNEEARQLEEQIERTRKVETMKQIPTSTPITTKTPIVINNKTKTNKSTRR